MMRWSLIAVGTTHIGMDYDVAYVDLEVDEDLDVDADVGVDVYAGMDHPCWVWNFPIHMIYPLNLDYPYQSGLYSATLILHRGWE